MKLLKPMAIAIMSLTVIASNEVFATNHSITKTQQSCINKNISIWEKQREKEINTLCKEMMRNGEECRTTIGGETLLREEALGEVTKKCTQKSK